MPSTWCQPSWGSLLCGSRYEQIQNRFNLFADLIPHGILVVSGDAVQSFVYTLDSQRNPILGTFDSDDCKVVLDFHRVPPALNQFVAPIFDIRRTASVPTVRQLRKRF